MICNKTRVHQQPNKENAFDIVFTLKNLPMLTFDLIYLENYPDGTESYIVFWNPLLKPNNLICNKAMFR